MERPAFEPPDGTARTGDRNACRSSWRISRPSERPAFNRAGRAGWSGARRAAPGSAVTCYLCLACSDDPLQASTPSAGSPSAVAGGSSPPGRCSCWRRFPLAPRAPGALSAGGFILDDLESARAKQLLQDELGVEAVGLRPRLHLGHAHGRHAGVAGGRRRGDARRRRGPARHPDPVARPGPAPGRARRAHGVRHRLPRPPAGRLARRDPGRPASGSTRSRASPSGPAAGPRSTATSSRSPSPTCAARELISLPLAALALILVFGSLVAAGVPLAVGGAAVLVALAGIFVVASLMPMSIFVLNLATLLGLGLGVDYSLLMTSRFREELAQRDGPGPRRRGRADHGRDGRASRVLLGPDGPARAAGPRAVRVHDPALGRDRRRDRRRARGGLGAHAAAGDPRDRRHAHRLARRASRHRGPGRRRAVGAARAPGDAPPGRRARPDADAPARPRRPVPARPVQRPGRDDPAAHGPVARGVRHPRVASSARASSRRSSSRSARPATRRRPTTSRSCTTTRVGSRRTRGSPASSASSTSTRASRSRSTSCSTRRRAGRRTGSWRRPWPRRRRAT